MSLCNESALNSRAVANNQSVIQDVMKSLDPAFQSDFPARISDRAKLHLGDTYRNHIRECWATRAAVAAALCAVAISIRCVMSNVGSAGMGSGHFASGIGIGTLLLLVAVCISCQQLWVESLRTRLKSLRAEAVALEEMAFVDPLTGLYNRWIAQDRLPQEIARCERSNVSLIVLCLDVNRLKMINDTYGHLVGDAVLRGFGQRIRETIRVTDVPVRVGGDEFLVLLPDCQPDEVTTILDRMRDLEVEIQNEYIAVTFSAGWAICNRGESPEQLLERADEQLYDEKWTARNTGNLFRSSPSVTRHSAPAQSFSQQ